MKYWSWRIKRLLNRRYDQSGAQWEKGFKKRKFPRKIRSFGRYDNLPNTTRFNKTTNSKPFLFFLWEIVTSQPELQHTIIFCAQLHVNSLKKVLSRVVVTMPSCSEKKKSFLSLLKNFSAQSHEITHHPTLLRWFGTPARSHHPSQSPASQMLLWLKWSKCPVTGSNILWKPSQKTGGCYGSNYYPLEWDDTCYLCV